MLRQWLPLAVCCTAVLCLPFPASVDDERDSDASRKVLGSSVVTSVSVIMDLGNGTKKYYADAAGNPVPKPTSASMLGSPPSLLQPDRYEFYTFNEAGDLVKRLMTLEEIQSIIASGDGEGGELPPNYYHQELPAGLKSPTLLGEGEIGELSSPVEGVHEVLESVQNVLKVEMQAAKNKTPTSSTSKPVTNNLSTWTSGEPMDTSTSTKTSTATTPTTYRPSSRKPVKKPTTYLPSSKRPTATSSTTTAPRTTASSSAGTPSTTTLPQKYSSRRPSPSSSQLPSKKPIRISTEKPQKLTSTTTRYLATATSSNDLLTTVNVPEKVESASKIPSTSDIDSNSLDNEENFASASNINSETTNKTKNNASENSTTESSTQKYSDKDEPVSKIVTSSWAAVADKTTENPTEKGQNSEYSAASDNEFSADSSVTSIQNIKPSVTVIANSTINTISGPSSTGKPGFENNPHINGNDESSYNGEDMRPSKNSSTIIQNVEPVVTVIINSTVNTASGGTNVRDPISVQPLFSIPGVFLPGAPNLEASPTLTVTERITAEDSSEEYTTVDSSSEEESSENLNVIQPVSTELPDNVLTTLLQILKAEVTTASSEEDESSELESQAFGIGKVNGIAASSIIETVTSQLEMSSSNDTGALGHLQPKPFTNESIFMDRNQSISSIVEMLMDEGPTTDETEYLVPAQNSVLPQEQTKISLNKSTQNTSVSSEDSNKITDILTPASSQSGAVVLYSNDLLAQTEKSKINVTPPKASVTSEEKFVNKTQASITTKNSSTETSIADVTMETTTNILETHDSTTYVVTDSDSEKDTLNKNKTEPFKTSMEPNENIETSSVTETSTKIDLINTSHNKTIISEASETYGVTEKQTIIPGEDDATEEIDSEELPMHHKLDNSTAIMPQASNKEQVVINAEKDNSFKSPTSMTPGSAANESKSENSGNSINISATSSDHKHAVTKLNSTELYTVTVPLINPETTTKMIETADDDETLSTIMPTLTTKKPVLTTPDSSEGLSASQSGIIAQKISPELMESVSNVLSQVSNKTVTTISTTDKETVSDITTQIITTNFGDATTLPSGSSTMFDEVNKPSTVIQNKKGNNTGTIYNISKEGVQQNSNISEGQLYLAETNKIFNSVTALDQQTTTNLYPEETTTTFSMEDKVKSVNESQQSTKLKQNNETHIKEVIKEDTTEVDMEKNLNEMPTLKNENQTQTGSTTTIQNEHETHTAAASLVDEFTEFGGKQNGSLGEPTEERESTTVVLQETVTPKLDESEEDTSATMFAENPVDTTTVDIQIAKNKPQVIVAITDMGDHTTLQPTLEATETMATDKLLLASQIKGTQVKFIDNEEDQLIKIATVTSPNRASQNDLEETSTSTWQKIFDSSEKDGNKATVSKAAETSTISTKDTNIFDASSTNAIKNISKIENILEGGNSIITEENKTKYSNANKNVSKIKTVPGITQVIFHTEIYDHLGTTDEPETTTLNEVGEIILPSKFVESIASPETTSAEEATSTENVKTEYPETSTETELDNEVKTTDKTWSMVSTVSPPVTRMTTTSRTMDHTDMRVTTLADSRRPAQSPPVDLHPAPAESLGLESTTLGLDKDVGDFAELCNELALRLWKPVANKRATVSRSLVMSPFAVTSLLAMVFLGARGGTSGQMNDILRLDDMVTFNPHQVFRNVTESLVNAKNPGVATAAFVRELYSDKAKGKLLDFYKERAQQFYDGHVEEVNFNMVGDVVRRRTNLLVKRQTSGRVPEYIRGSNIMLRPPLSVFSANIFQTDCSAASTSGRDGEMYFTVIPASRQRRLVPVPAVVWRSGFLAGYDPMLDATAVAIGEADSLVSTVLVLPGQQGNTAPGDSVAALEDRLWNSQWSQGAWSRLLRSLLPRPGLELQLPRFSHRSMLNLTNTLQRMGLRDLFSEGRADLKGLNGLANDLHLSDIVQVNTFGTCGELTADARHHVEVFPGTSQRVGRLHGGDLHDSSGIPLALRPRQARLPEAPRLRLDRPFLYVVRHNPTGLILHMGRFNPRLVR